MMNEQVQDWESLIAARMRPCSTITKNDDPRKNNHRMHEKKFRDKHPNYYKEWYAKHREEKLAYNRKWKEEHRKECLEYCARHRAKKRRMRDAELGKLDSRA